MDDPKSRWETVCKTTSTKNVNLSETRSYSVQTDLKHLLFTLSRYKFASKLVAHEKKLSLLELGCLDGLGINIFKQTNVFDRIVGVDLDTAGIKWGRENIADERTEFIEDNFFNKKYGDFDMVLSLDVIEHISVSEEGAFLSTIAKNLSDTAGIAVIGTPNRTFFPYASAGSKIGHINNFDQQRLHDLCKTQFNNVFMFGMNDEVLHTGFDQFCCYIFAVCCNKTTR